jgi:hypothetical protein
VLRRSRVLFHSLILAAYAALTLAMTWPLAREVAAAIPGDGFDGWQNYWNLWWLKVALVAQVRSPLATDLLYYPTGVSLYFHTLNPLNGLIALPVQLAFGLIPAYNAVVLLSFTLAGYGMFLLARWLIFAVVESDPAFREGVKGSGTASDSMTPSRKAAAAEAAAFVASLIFTFAPFHFAHLLGHMQVFSYEWLPFYALALLRGVHNGVRGGPWLRTSLLAGLFLAFAGYTDWYFVLYLLIFSMLAAGWAGAWAAAQAARGAQGGRVRHALAALARAFAPVVVAGIVFAVLVSPALAPMIAETVRYEFMLRPARDLYLYSASVADFFVPNRLHTLTRPESFTWPGNQVAPVSEHTIAIGYVALLLGLAALLRAPKRAAFWLLAGGFFFLLALGPAIHLGSIVEADIPQGSAPASGLLSWTPFSLVYALVPFARLARSVSRYALMVQFCAAVLAALGLHALLTARQVRRGALLGATGIVAALILAEYWVAPYPMSPPDTPEVYRALPPAPEGSPALLNLPMNYDRPGYLLYQTEYGRPLTVAYISRDDPRTLAERVPVLQHFRHLGPDILADDPARVAATVFQDLGVGTVVLDRYKMPGGLEREYTEALAAAIFAGQPPDYQDDRVTVYTVRPPDAPQPYLRLGAEGWGPAEKDEEGRVTGRALRGAAAVEALHAPEGAWLRVRFRAADEAGAVLRVTADDGSLLAEEAAGPQAREIVVPLGASGRVTLEGEGVTVEEIGFTGS